MDRCGRIVRAGWSKIVPSKKAAFSPPGTSPVVNEDESLPSITHVSEKEEPESTKQVSLKLATKTPPASSSGGGPPSPNAGKEAVHDVLQQLVNANDASLFAKFADILNQRSGKYFLDLKTIKGDLEELMNEPYTTIADSGTMKKSKILYAGHEGKLAQKFLVSIRDHDEVDQHATWNVAPEIKAEVATSEKHLKIPFDRLLKYHWEKTRLETLDTIPSVQALKRAPSGSPEPLTEQQAAADRQLHADALLDVQKAFSQTVDDFFQTDPFAAIAGNLVEIDGSFNKLWTLKEVREAKEPQNAGIDKFHITELQLTYLKRAETQETTWTHETFNKHIQDMFTVEEPVKKEESIRTGPRWVLLLSGDLSSKSLGDFSSGQQFGSVEGSDKADYRIGLRGAQLKDKHPSKLKVINGDRIQEWVGPFDFSALDNTCTTCNCKGKELKPDLYWHGGRGESGCYGSTHFGLSSNGDVHVKSSPSDQHWGHFHRPHVNTGLYTFGDDDVSEVEWDQRYLLYAYFDDTEVDGTSFVLAPEGEKCPSGADIEDVKSCWKAYQTLNDQNLFTYKAKRKLGDGSTLPTIGSWNGVPFKCSIQFQGSYVSKEEDSSPHWNTKSDGDDSRLKSGEFRAICRGSDASSIKVTGEPQKESIEPKAPEEPDLSALNEDVKAIADKIEEVKNKLAQEEEQLDPVKLLQDQLVPFLQAASTKTMSDAQFFWDVFYPPKEFNFEASGFDISATKSVEDARTGVLQLVQEGGDTDGKLFSKTIATDSQMEKIVWSLEVLKKYVKIPEQQQGAGIAFQLKGDEGSEVVKVTCPGGKETEKTLTTTWQDESCPDAGEILINFTNDDGPRNVKFQATNTAAVTYKIWLKNKDAAGKWNGAGSWNCDGLETWQSSVPQKTSDGDKNKEQCQAVRQGHFNWSGVYHVEATESTTTAGPLDGTPWTILADQYTSTKAWSEIMELNANLKSLKADFYRNLIEKSVAANSAAEARNLVRELSKLKGSREKLDIEVPAVLQFKFKQSVSEFMDRHKTAHHVGLGCFLGPEGGLCPTAGEAILDAGICDKCNVILDKQSNDRWKGNDATIPPGCAWRFQSAAEAGFTTFSGNKGTLHFNSHTTGQGRADLQPICRKGPDATPSTTTTKPEIAKKLELEPSGDECNAPFQEDSQCPWAPNKSKVHSEFIQDLEDVTQNGADDFLQALVSAELSKVVKDLQTEVAKRITLMEPPEGQKKMLRQILTPCLPVDTRKANPEAGATEDWTYSPGPANHCDQGVRVSVLSERWDIGASAAWASSLKNWRFFLLEQKFSGPSGDAEKICVGAKQDPENLVCDPTAEKVDKIKFDPGLLARLKKKVSDLWDDLKASSFWKAVEAASELRNALKAYMASVSGSTSVTVKLEGESWTGSGRYRKGLRNPHRIFFVRIFSLPY